jgi:hypothetical protein
MGWFWADDIGIVSIASSEMGTSATMNFLSIGASPLRLLCQSKIHRKRGVGDHREEVGILFVDGQERR